MSKAFTSEEAPEPELVLRAPPRLAPGEVRYVTPEGHAALRARLAAAEHERAEAAALPEPARAAAAEARAALLQGTLAVLTVLGPEAAPEGTAAFGSWVTVEEEDGARRTWRIVGPDEADAKRGLVSAAAPLARALLGRRAGDAVQVARPGGALEVTVVEVRRSPPP